MATMAKTDVELTEELIQYMEKHENCKGCKTPELVEEVMRYMEKHENCNRCKMPPELKERMRGLMSKGLEKRDLPIEPPQGEVTVPIEKQ